MRVMTWNVFWRWGGDYRLRAPGIVDTLQIYRPDVLGLVETWAGEGTSQPAVTATRTVSVLPPAYVTVSVAL